MARLLCQDSPLKKDQLRLLRAPQPRVQHVPHGVAKEVEPVYRQGEGNPRPYGQPGSNGVEVPGR
ncbi:MAG: hypothetical protein HW388_1096, partial [Dehalococcoidia bacterium]|nr:hypothetical protein [Dehalococcoidia bacterium]